MLAVIVANTLFIAIATDNNVREKKNAQGEVVGVEPVPALEGSIAWYLVDVLFLLIFVSELSYRYYYHRSNTWKDPYNCFDAFVIFLGCLDSFFLALLFPSEAGMLRVLTVLRTLRLVKLLRIIRTLKFTKELVRIVDAIRFMIISVCLTLKIMLLLLIIGGVAMVVLVGKKEVNGDFGYIIYEKKSGWDNKSYFGNSFKSFWTLFSIVVQSQETFKNVIRPVSEVQPVLSLFFLFLIVILIYGLMNILLSVIVTQVMAMAKTRDKKEAAEDNARRLYAGVGLKSMFLRVKRQKRFWFLPVRPPTPGCTLWSI